jgi:hypothetical protein
MCIYKYKCTHIHIHMFIYTYLYIHIYIYIFIYTAVTGDVELRQAICNDLLKRKNVSYSPEEIVVANGAKQSVIQALLSIVSPGDGVCMYVYMYRIYVYYDVYMYYIYITICLVSNGVKQSVIQALLECMCFIFLIHISRIFLKRIYAGWEICEIFLISRSNPTKNVRSQ